MSRLPSGRGKLETTRCRHLDLGLHGDVQGERFVRRSWRRSCRSSSPATSLIVSDDGSTDATLEILSSLADARVRVLKDGGFRDPVRNFERALEHARAEVVVLCDQDDVCSTTSWRSSASSSRRRPRRRTCRARRGDRRRARAAARASVQRRLKAGPGLLRNPWTNRYPGCCMAFSADLLDAALPIPRRMPMHDMWLGQLCERIGRTDFVPRVTMLYRRHDESLTGFEIEFRPLVQIGRRTVLALALASRTIAYRRGRLPRSPRRLAATSRHP